MDDSELKAMLVRIETDGIGLTKWEKEFVSRRKFDVFFTDAQSRKIVQIFHERVEGRKTKKIASPRQPRSRRAYPQDPIPNHDLWT